MGIQDMRVAYDFTPNQTVKKIDRLCIKIYGEKLPIDRVNSTN